MVKRPAGLKSGTVRGSASQLPDAVRNRKTTPAPSRSAATLSRQVFLPMAAKEVQEAVMGDGGISGGEGAGCGSGARGGGEGPTLLTVAWGGDCSVC